MSMADAKELEGFDVVVAGAGMAGFAAAISAAEQGASVLLLEKMAEYGGSTAWSGGAFSFAGTEQQAALDIRDSKELLRADLTKGGEDKVCPDLIDLYVSRQQEVYGWLRKLGVQFAPPVLSPGQSVARSHAVNTRPMLKLLHEHFTAQPRCKYVSQAQVVRIERDDRGVARVVRARIQGEEVSFTARKAVVLASGGFSRSQDVFERFAPWLQKAKRMGGEGATGDALRIGGALGGALTDFGYLEGTFGAILPNYPCPQAWVDNDTILMHAVYSGAIILNKEGRRFADESLSYRKLGNICLEQPDAVAFQLFDQQVMDASREDPVTRNFKAALQRGLIQQADTVGEAAEMMGLPGEVVQAELQAYNRGIESEGRDPVFGRASLLNGQGRPIALVKAPFYIYACTTGISSTYAGLLANGRMQLVDVFGDPVEGVYLAGELVGGFHGPMPVSGTSICKAAIFGRAAGQNAAQEERVA